MNAEIISVGSELLLGQIANTNAQFLSKELAQLGINVYYHTAVGDNSVRLSTIIQQAKKRSNIIIFTGGLGPTKDDLTKETIAQFLGKKLVYSHQALDNIEDYFRKVNRTMTENNKKQAYVLEDSSVLPNDNGMAPGMAIEVEGVTFMLLPGPPKELNPMFTKYGRAYLVDAYGEGEKIESRVLRFFGIGESQLETEINDLIEKQSNPTIAPLAADGEVTLRLTAKGSSKENIQQLLNAVETEILTRLKPYFYGYGDDTSLAGEVVESLRSKGLTISSAESLTGGMFSQVITSFTGASEITNGSIVCYSNEAKINLLNISAETIKKEGSISEKCAKEMAENARNLFSSDIGVGFTGVAGPTMSEGKEVGTVYIGIARNGFETNVHTLKLAGGRAAIRSRAVKYGLFHLLKLLKK